MIGDKWKSEIREFKDDKTGRTIRQLTTTGNNVHLYFTENSFDAQRNEIIFRSDRATGQDRAPHENPFYDLFRMNLDSGEIVQLTDEAAQGTGDENGSIHSVTKTPDSQIVVYRTANLIKQLDPATGALSVVYAESGNYNLGSPSIAPNRRYLAFSRYDQAVAILDEVMELDEVKQVEDWEKMKRIRDHYRYPDKL